VAAICCLDPSVGSPVDRPIPGRSIATVRVCCEAKVMTCCQVRQDCGQPCTNRTGVALGSRASTTCSEDLPTVTCNFQSYVAQFLSGI